jgi:DNA-binding NarL/FixJ family response regulator
MTKPIRVWLIEDHKTYRERLASTLNRLEDITCSQCFTACEDALAALLKQEPPQVLLLDVELPGMSGIDALASIRELAPSTTIVIITVFEDDDKIFRAISAGATGYLLKTSNVEDIASAIRIAAAGGSPINPKIARRVLAMFSQANPGHADYGLTPREHQILQLLVQGHTIKAAASQLGIGYYTADEYIRSVYKKLHVQSRGSAIAKAVKERLV